jgi:hypothetical protein
MALTHLFRYQVAGGLAGFGYSFVMTLVLLALMQIISIWIPSLELRAPGTEDEPPRLDRDELGDKEAVSFSIFPTFVNAVRLLSEVPH